MFKNKKRYNITVILTFLIPLISLLLYFYITDNKAFNELNNVPHIVFNNAEKKYDYMLDEKDFYSIDIENKTLSFHADLMTYNDIEIQEGKITIEIPKVFSIGKKYYFINEENLLQEFDTKKAVEETLFKKSFVISINVIIFIGVVMFVLLFIMKKMKFMEKHRRLSTMIGLWAISIFFLILSLITENAFLVFFVFSISFTLYYIEWLIYRMNNKLPLTDQIVQKVEMV